jgi:hypothetical protein
VRHRERLPQDGPSRRSGSGSFTARWAGASRVGGARERREEGARSPWRRGVRTRGEEIERRPDELAPPEGEVRGSGQTGLVARRRADPLTREEASEAGNPRRAGRSRREIDRLPRTDSTGLNRDAEACRVPSSRKTIGKTKLPITTCSLHTLLN